MGLIHPPCTQTRHLLLSLPEVCSKPQTLVPCTPCALLCCSLSHFPTALSSFPCAIQFASPTPLRQSPPKCKAVSFTPGA